MSGPILIMAGGTGGHVFPALAVARALRGRDQEVVWLGTRKGLEASLIPDEGIPMEWIRIAGLRGKGIFSWLLAPLKLLVAVVDAIGVLVRRRPKVVLGMGGFASGPGGFAAWLLRRPLIIHEQNSVAGLTNRLLAGFAREVLEAFPGSFSSGVETRLVGNPVRSDILALGDPAQRLAGHGEQLRILVLGGSQGAKVLNELVPPAIALLPAGRQPAVWHQAGSLTFDIAEQAYAAAGVPAKLEQFIDDIATAYEWADLVICRAGALTISELTAAGLGAVFIPFPSAADDHQVRNAEFMVAAGAGVVIPQSRLTPQLLADELKACVEDRQIIIDRAVCARSLAKPDATEVVAERCLAIAS